ncbi:hypothetical protein ACF0H5_014377 [Mactra antiquata]
MKNCKFNMMQHDFNPNSKQTEHDLGASGEITINPLRSEEFTGIYRLGILVQNTKSLKKDSTNITVVMAPLSETDHAYSFEEKQQNGYEKLLSRHRRAAVPATMTFTLPPDNGETANVSVGGRVIQELKVTFPVGSSTDIQLEFFAPDSVDNVMVLCNVEVTDIGADLSITGSTNVVFGAKNGYSNETLADWAKIDLGVVTNTDTGSNELTNSTISIVYEAVMIESDVVTGTNHWISAGALFDNENFIWVVQTKVNVINDYDYTVLNDPLFNVTMPASFALGSTNLVSLEMFIPYPVSNYVVKIFPPADTVGLVSICAIRVGAIGDHFQCINDFANTTTDITKNPQGVGYTLAEANLGRLLNKASRDLVPDITGNLITVETLVHLYADAGLPYLSQTLSLGMALIVDSTSVWVGGADFVVDPEVETGLTDPQMVGSPATSLAVGMDNAVIFEPFEINYTVKIPTPTTPDVSSHYILEMLAPMDGVIPEFSVCQFNVISYGSDLSCLILEDLEVEYSSRSGGAYIEADRARIDLGHIINMGFNVNGTDNEIVAKAVLMPLNYSSNVGIGSRHNITFGILVGNQSVTLATNTIEINAERAFTPVANNSMQPTFEMYYYDAQPSIEVGASTKVYVNMTTEASKTYKTIDAEFIMPKLLDNYAYLHICKVEIESSGANLPCLTPEWYNDQFSYVSSFGDYIMDRATLTMDGICNYQSEGNTEEDMARFAVYLKVLDRPELQSGVIENVGVGLKYTNNDMWIGNLQLHPSRGYSHPGPSGSSYVFTTQVSPYGAIAAGLTKIYRTLIKIPRGDSADFSMVINTVDTNLEICTARIIRAGKNLPCVADEVAARTYTGLSSLDLKLGIIKNYGDGVLGNMTANAFFDDDSFEVEYIIRASPTAAALTYGFNVNLYFNKARTSPLTSTYNDFEVTEATGISETITDPVNLTTTIGEITGGDNTSTITFGEAKRILVSAVIPENTLYRVRVRVIIPSEHVGKLELCDAAVVAVGDNLPCVSKTMDGNLRSSTSGAYMDTAEFDLGYVCSRPLRPGDEVANTVVFEAYVRLVPNGMATLSDLLTVTSTVQLFSTNGTVDTVTFTVEDPTNFVDRYSDITGQQTSTMVSINETGTIAMGISEVRTIEANLSIPAYSVSRLLFDVDLPVSDSACLTVLDVRVKGSVGRNVLCVEPDINNKNVVYAPEYESAQNTSQYNYMFLDLGIVTNTGKSHRQGTFIDGDDDVVVEFDIQMADCDINLNETVLQLSIGKKISDYVVIYDHDVQVIRTVKYINGTVYHNASSNSEGRNTSIFIFLPFYQVAPAVLTYSNNNQCVVQNDPAKSSLLHIECENFFFTDRFEYTAQIDLNSSVTLPSGMSADPTYVFSMITTNFHPFSSYYNTSSWWPDYSDELQIFNYSLTVPSATGGCDSTLGVENSAVVLDCQFVSSAGNKPGTSAFDARYGSASEWVPFVRDGDWASHRYVGVYFGHLHRFTSIIIKNVVGYNDKTTEVEASYTNDGMSYFGQEIVSLGSNPNVDETRTLSGIVARGVRLAITNDTANGVKPQVGFQFKLFGCIQTDPDGVSNLDACNVVANSVGSPDFYTRSFVAVSTSEIYYCDRDVKTKKERGRCYGTTDGGAKWKHFDRRIGSLIGYSPVDTSLYAYNNDKVALMKIYPASNSIFTVSQTNVDEAKLVPGWLPAIPVEEIDSFELSQPVPTANYIQNSVGATYGGLISGGLMVMKWN